MDDIGRIGDPVELPFIGLACPEEVRQFSKWELGRFLRLQKIGSGFASTVYLCMDTFTNRRLALKTYRKSALNTAVREAIYMEVAIQGRLRHPHILGLYAAFDDGGYICILSGLAEDSDLHRRLPDIRREERTIVKYVVGPLLSAVGTLHINGVMHRDLKPENILLQGSSLLLADFGFAVCVPRHRPVTRLGTLHFMAPEVILNDPFEGRTMRERVPRKARLPYDAAVDVWAIGVIVYEVLFRKSPFDGPDEDDVVKDILAAAPAFDGDISPEAYDFLRQCLAYDPRNRPNTCDLYRHPWVTMHMPQDKWELLLPDNFATPESVGCGMELLGDNTCGGGHRGSTDGLHGKDGEMPTMRRFRKHAGSLGASEHAYDGERGAVQRLRQKAVHSQFAMADGAVSFAGSRAGSATGSVDALHAALTAQHRTFAGVGHSGHSGRLQSSFSTGKVRRSADITERSVGSFPHIHMLSNATPQPSRHGRLPSEAQNSPSMQRHIPPGALTATARASMEHRGHGSYSRAAVADTDNGVQKIQEGEGDGEQATLAASVSTGVGLRDKGSGRQGSGETGGSGPRQKEGGLRRLLCFCKSKKVSAS